ncbi:hypothetical protein V8D89_013327 [Ganoderma adspersum]
MQTNTSRTSPAPGASPAAINAHDAPMKGSDVLQIPLVELLARNPAMRIDWDRKTNAVNESVPFLRNAVTSCQTHHDVPPPLPPALRQFFHPALHLSAAHRLHRAAQCIQNLYGVPDGASHQTILVQANRIDAEGTNDNCDNAQPRPCQIHEAQNARACGAAESGTSTSTSTPRSIRPLPRRNRILNGSGGSAPTAASPNPNPNPSPSATQAGATYDNTNTPPASSDADDIPLDVLKQEVAARRKRKARTAAAVFEPVIKKEPIEKEPGKRLHPERHQFKIRGLEEHVSWYYTQSKRPIDAVPAVLLKPCHEALYVHRFRVPFVGWQAWIYIKYTKAGGQVQASAGAGAGAGAAGSSGSRDGNGGGNQSENQGQAGERQGGEWRRVEIGNPHPRLEGLVLHMLDDDGPRWVKPQSARHYASGKHKRARWARNM